MTPEPLSIYRPYITPTASAAAGEKAAPSFEETLFSDIESGKSALATVDNRILLEVTLSDGTKEYYLPEEQPFFLAARIVSGKASSDSFILADVEDLAKNQHSLEQKTIAHFDHTIGIINGLQDIQEIQALAYSLGVSTVPYDLYTEEGKKAVIEEILAKYGQLAATDKFQAAIKFLGALVCLKTKKGTFEGNTQNVADFFNKIAGKGEGKARLVVNPKRNTLPDGLRAQLQALSEQLKQPADSSEPTLFIASQKTIGIGAGTYTMFRVDQALDIKKADHLNAYLVLQKLVAQADPATGDKFNPEERKNCYKFLTRVNSGLIDKDFDEDFGFGKFEDEKLVDFLRPFFMRSRRVVGETEFKQAQKDKKVITRQIIVRTEAQKQAELAAGAKEQDVLCLPELFDGHPESTVRLYVVTLKTDTPPKKDEDDDEDEAKGPKHIEYRTLKLLAIERFKAIMREAGLGGWNPQKGVADAADFYLAQKTPEIRRRLIAEGNALQGLYLSPTGAPDELLTAPVPLAPEPNASLQAASTATFDGLLKQNGANLEGRAFLQSNGLTLKVTYDNSPQRNIVSVTVQSYPAKKRDAVTSIFTIDFQTGDITWHIPANEESNALAAQRRGTLAGLQFLFNLLDVPFDANTPSKFVAEKLIEQFNVLQYLASRFASRDNSPILSLDEAVGVAEQAKQVADILTKFTTDDRALSPKQKEAFYEALAQIIIDVPSAGQFEGSNRYRTQTEALAVRSGVSAFKKICDDPSKAAKVKRFMEILTLLFTEKKKVDSLSEDDQDIFEEITGELEDAAGDLYREEEENVSQAILGIIYSLYSRFSGSLADVSLTISALDLLSKAIPELNTVAAQSVHYIIENALGLAQGTQEYTIDSGFVTKLTQSSRLAMRKAGTLVDGMTLPQILRSSPIGRALEVTEKSTDLTDNGLAQLALDLVSPGLTEAENRTIYRIFFGQGEQAITEADLNAINKFLALVFNLKSPMIMPLLEDLERYRNLPSLNQQNLYQIRVCAAYQKQNDFLSMVAPRAYLISLTVEPDTTETVEDENYIPERLGEEAPGLLLMMVVAQGTKASVGTETLGQITYAPDEIDAAHLAQIYERFKVSASTNDPEEQLNSIIVSSLDDSIRPELERIEHLLMESDNDADAMGALLFRRLIDSVSQGYAAITPAERQYLRELQLDDVILQNVVAELNEDTADRPEALRPQDSILLGEFTEALSKGLYGANQAIDLELNPLEANDTDIQQALKQHFGTEDKHLGDLRLYADRLARALDINPSAHQNKSYEELIVVTAGYLKKINHRVLSPATEQGKIPDGILNQLAIYCNTQLTTQNMMPQDRSLGEDLLAKATKYSNPALLFNSLFSVISSDQGPMATGSENLARIKAIVEPDRAMKLFAKTHELALLKAFQFAVTAKGQLVRGNEGRFFLVSSLKQAFLSMGIDIESLAQTDLDKLEDIDEEHKAYYRAALALYQAAKDLEKQAANGDEPDFASVSQALNNFDAAVNALVVKVETDKKLEKTSRTEAGRLLGNWLGQKEGSAAELEETIKKDSRITSRLTQYFEGQSLSREFFVKLSHKLNDQTYLGSTELYQLVTYMGGLLAESATETAPPHPIFPNMNASVLDLGAFVAEKLNDENFHGYDNVGITVADLADHAEALRQNKEKGLPVTDFEVKVRLGAALTVINPEEEITPRNLYEAEFGGWGETIIGTDGRVHLGRQILVMNGQSLAPGQSRNALMGTLLDPQKSGNAITTNDALIYGDRTRSYYVALGLEKLLFTLHGGRARQAFIEGQTIHAALIPNARQSRFFTHFKAEDKVSDVYFVYLADSYLQYGEASLTVKYDPENPAYAQLIADLEAIKSKTNHDEKRAAFLAAKERFVAAVISGELKLNPKGHLNFNPLEAKSNIFGRQSLQEVFQNDDRVYAEIAAVAEQSKLFGAYYGVEADRPKENESLATIFFLYLLTDYLDLTDEAIANPVLLEMKLHIARISNQEKYQEFLDAAKALRGNADQAGIKRVRELFVALVNNGDITLAEDGYLDSKLGNSATAVYGRTGIFDQLRTTILENDAEYDLVQDGLLGYDEIPNDGKYELVKSGLLNDDSPTAGKIEGVAPLGHALRRNQEIDMNIRLTNLIFDMNDLQYGRANNVVGEKVIARGVSNPTEEPTLEELQEIGQKFIVGLGEYFKDAHIGAANSAKKAFLYDQLDTMPKEARVVAEIAIGYLAFYLSMGNIVDIAGLRTLIDQIAQPLGLDTTFTAPLTTLIASFFYVAVPLVPYVQAFYYLKNGDYYAFFGALAAGHHTAVNTFKSWRRTPLIGRFLDQKVFYLDPSGKLSRGHFTDPVAGLYWGMDQLRKRYPVRPSQPAAPVTGPIWKRAAIHTGRAAGYAGRAGVQVVAAGVNGIRGAENVASIVADRFISTANWGFNGLRRGALAVGSLATDRLAGPEIVFEDAGGERTITIEGEEYTVDSRTLDRLQSRSGNRALNILRATKDFDPTSLWAAKKELAKAGFSEAEIDTLLAEEDPRTGQKTGLLRRLKFREPASGFFSRLGRWATGERGRVLSQFQALKRPYQTGFYRVSSFLGRAIKTNKAKYEARKQAGAPLGRAASAAARAARSAVNTAGNAAGRFAANQARQMPGRAARAARAAGKAAAKVGKGLGELGKATVNLAGRVAKKLKPKPKPKKSKPAQTGKARRGTAGRPAGRARRAGRTPGARGTGPAPLTPQQIKLAEQVTAGIESAKAEAMLRIDRLEQRGLISAEEAATMRSEAKAQWQVELNNVRRASRDGSLIETLKKDAERIRAEIDELREQRKTAKGEEFNRLSEEIKQKQQLLELKARDIRAKIAKFTRKHGAILAFVTISTLFATRGQSTTERAKTLGIAYAGYGGFVLAEKVVEGLLKKTLGSGSRYVKVAGSFVSAGIETITTVAADQALWAGDVDQQAIALADASYHAAKGYAIFTVSGEMAGLATALFSETGPLAPVAGALTFVGSTALLYLLVDGLEDQTTKQWLNEHRSEAEIKQHLASLGLNLSVSSDEGREGFFGETIVSGVDSEGHPITVSKAQLIAYFLEQLSQKGLLKIDSGLPVTLALDSWEQLTADNIAQVIAAANSMVKTANLDDEDSRAARQGYSILISASDSKNSEVYNPLSPSQRSVGTVATDTFQAVWVTPIRAQTYPPEQGYLSLTDLNTQFESSRIVSGDEKAIQTAQFINSRGGDLNYRDVISQDLRLPLARIREVPQLIGEIGDMLVRSGAYKPESLTNEKGQYEVGKVQAAYVRYAAECEGNDEAFIQRDNKLLESGSLTGTEINRDVLLRLSAESGRWTEQVDLYAAMTPELASDFVLELQSKGLISKEMILKALTTSIVSTETEKILFEALEQQCLPDGEFPNESISPEPIETRMES